MVSDKQLFESVYTALNSTMSTEIRTLTANTNW